MQTSYYIHITDRDKNFHTKQVRKSSISQSIIEIDSLIVIQAINRKSITPGQIRNLIDDINMLQKDIENLNFIYYRRFANELTDRIPKETI